MGRDQRAYTMIFWAVFIGFVMVPALALSIELGRYFYVISEVAKGADAAAVAASAEINQRTFRDSGALVPPSKTWANAQSFVSQNTAGLSVKGVHAYVTGIQVSGGANTVRVMCPPIFRSFSHLWYPVSSSPKQARPNCEQ